MAPDVCQKVLFQSYMCRLFAVCVQFMFNFQNLPSSFLRQSFSLLKSKVHLYLTESPPGSRAPDQLKIKSFYYRCNFLVAWHVVIRLQSDRALDRTFISVWPWTCGERLLSIGAPKRWEKWKKKLPRSTGPLFRFNAAPHLLPAFCHEKANFDARIKLAKRRRFG